MFKSDEDASHGFSIFFLANEPRFPQEFDDVLGYRSDFKGLGVFLYRSEKRRKWVSLSCICLKSQHAVFFHRL